MSFLKKYRPDNRVRYFIILPLLFLSYILSYSQTDSLAQITAKPILTPLETLQNDINSILDNTDFSNAFIGISILSVETGEFFYKLNENKNFIPASTQKLFTTAAALNYLGKDFKYTTTVYLDGMLKKNGEFVGNIIIRGSGDPTLSFFYHSNPMQILDHWAKKLDSLGIKSVKGNIIGDDSYFDGQSFPPGWAIDDLIYPYSAEVSSLSINDNKIDIVLKSGEAQGEPAKISENPLSPYVRVINNTKTVGENELFVITPVREINTNIINLYGSIPFDSTKKKEKLISVTVHNPTQYFLNLFRKSLEKNNIKYTGALLSVEDYNEDIDYSGLQQICFYISPKLQEIISVTNKTSHNLAAEMLLKTLGKETTGIGSYESGIDYVKKFISKANISPDNITIVDGSGLSRLNLCTPGYQVAFLSAMYRSDDRLEFMNSLAEPGKTGTLKRRMTRSLAEKNVLAKTGSMNNVSNICGYVRTRDDEMLAFSIMINNYILPESLAQNLQDLICMRLSSFSRTH